MTKNQTDTTVDVKDLSTSVKKISPEDQEAAQRAYEEFQALTLGKKEMNMKELYDLKQYARKRTDINKADDLLTPDQVVWKALFTSIDDLISKNMKADEKANLDRLQEEMDSLGELGDLVNQIVPLGQAIETEVIMQHAALTVYFDKGPENNYKRVVDGVTTDLVDPNKWSPTERIEKAEVVLKIIDANREHLYKKQLVERHEVIHKKLQEFGKIFNTLESIIKNNPKILDDQSLSRLFDTTREWLRLTKDLYASRTRAIAAVKNSIDSDEFLPKYILERKGDVSGNISTGNSFFEQMAAVVVLINKANEEENELAKKREPLSEELFGKADSYIKFPKEESSEQAQNQTKPTSSGKKTKWFIVIALTIVALSWGIWTAIGVFVLGSIMINVLSSKSD